MVGKYIQKLLFAAGLCLLSFNAGAQTSTNLSTDSTTGCAPFEVNFKPNSTSAKSYFWDFGNGSTSVLANPTAIYLKNGIYKVMLIETDAAGNKDTIYQNKDIEVVTNPRSDFSLTKSTVCQGSIFEFTNASTNATTYFWDFGDGYSSTDVNPKHTYTVSGSYTVKLLASNIYGCRDVLEKKVSVIIDPKPKATFTVNKQSTCDVSFQFQFSSTDAASKKWLWNFGDGQTSTDKLPAHTYASAGTYTVSLVTYNNAGCTDTVTEKDYIYIENNLVPTFDINTLTSCANSSVKFTYTGTKMTKYLWDFGDGKTSTLENPAHQYASPGNYTIKLQTTSKAGCKYSYTYPNPVAIKITNLRTNFSGGGQGCTPLETSFTNLSLNAKSYIWYFGDGTTSTDKNPTHIYTTPGKYLVKLVATSNNGECVQEYSVKDAVEVFDLPEANFQSKTRGGCAPYKVVLKNTSINGETWLWNFGDGTTSTDENPVHTYANEGVYTITLTVISTNGCVNTFSQKDYIKVKNLPVNYTTPDPITVCGPYTTAFSYATLNSVSWNWNFGDGTTSTEQNPTHTFTSPGEYIVSLNSVTSEGCPQNIAVFQKIIIKDVQAKFTFARKNDCPPYLYSFTDSSKDAVSWFWNFGDGSKSTQQNPSHSFSTSGDYMVTLTVKNAAGCTSVYKMKVSTPIFYASPSKTYSNPDFKFPLTVSFKANSKGATGWFWDFDDNGSTSTSPNPTHTYNDSNIYKVKLTITNAKCTLTYIIVIKPPVPKEETDPTENDTTVNYELSVISGCVPLWVNFTNKSKNIATYSWDFGDGETSTEKDPLHVYTKAGYYTVKYTETNTKTGKVTTLTKYVRVTQPEAKFVMNQNITDTEIQVAFVDSSKNAVSWFWSFGDGNTSTDKNPFHIYAAEDKYVTVKLTIVDTSGCSNSTSQIIYLGGGNPLTANATSLCKQDSLILTSSYKHFNNYLFSFGDGQSKQTNTYRASHIYAQAGKYLPGLKITDSYGRTYSYTLPDSVNIYSPKADFSVSGDSVSCDIVTLQFTNKSIGADKWLWTFSDGKTSTDKNPTHTFHKSGRISASLKAIGAGCSDEMTKMNIGEVLTAKPNFTTKQNGSCFPITVLFFDASKDAVSWFWDFGDGSTSTDKNPVHIFYANPATVTSLKITDKNGCSGTLQKQGVDILDAKFKANVTDGCGPLTVTFTALDTQATTFLWNFGDGTTSTQKKPTHVYTQEGKFTVSLKVGTSQVCKDSLTIGDYIIVQKPHADFTSPQVSSCAPSAVTFEDKSTDAKKWLWSFGDGSVSTLQNPAHIYSVPGFYDVKLIVTNKNGCKDSVLKKKFIHVRGPISKFTVSSKRGCLPFKVSFTDASQNAVSWKWNFGNGSTSTDKNPEYEYNESGKFYVTLITKDSTGCESSYTLGEPLVVDDTLAPAVSPILAVSVVSDKSISIQWMPNADDDFKTYILYRQNASTSVYEPIYTSFDKNIITYIDSNVNATNAVYLYKLQTVDRCGNTVPVEQLIAHGNINLEAVPQGEAIAVTWTPYIGCNVNTYTLYREQENSVAQLIATLSGTTLSFIDSTFQCPVKYTYRVMATDLCGNAVSSWSDVSTATPVNVIIEQKSPVIRTTVLAETNQTFTEWQAASRIDKIAGYNIMRSTDNGAFELVDRVQKEATEYTDNKVDVNAHYYTYLVMAANNCDILAPKTLPGNSILLQGEAANENTIHLHWNKYDGWQEGIEYYLIERKDLNGNWQPIGTVPGSRNTFDDKE